MDAIANLLGYQVTKQLYSGSRTSVYRGWRESDQQPVVIKLLRNEYPTFSELVQFRNQYTIGKNLDLPSIVKPLDLVAYKNAYALVMEDFGGISLPEYLHQKTAEQKLELSNVLPLADFLDIAIQLATSLDGIIQQRVIHKDIKPANILINPDTKQIKLIDFSISSLLPRETQEIQNPNVLEGTLAYLSPEQTGRMNRGIDYRTDFYSLGVTFYELLTGQLPFVSNDPMELVHCHIAKIPPTVHTLNPAIPPFLSAIVSKLMKKNAENRYQSAFGLKYDLEICRSLTNANALAEGQEIGTIPTFEIGKRDLTNRFLIPEKLYGRESEVETLLNAFERVSQGSTEMMLVEGFSGIGKTVVVNEVHKPIVRQHGYFIKGKYDQFQRNIPFSAFVQAFRDLMGQLLSESDAQLQKWKSTILSVVGDNGQVLIEVIPELENIIGAQPTAPELSGSAAQNRFNLLMQKFVQVFTTKEHPLVMFLDDLQWADSASLKLLQLLMEDTGHLLVLGAYRDNEVSPVHPLIVTVDEIVKAGATVNTITLQPLSLSDMNQLVADTLNCDLTIAQPLTELVYQKTQGNPFFATQFLKALHDDNLITFDWDIRHWQCEIAQVRALAITNDVVEFMALQLQKLPSQSQEILKLAACIGAQFDMNTLAIVGESSPEETAAVLWKSLQEGFILPTTEIYKFFIQTDAPSAQHSIANPTYKFLHDRVQQAAYSLIIENQKKATHLKIGQLLFQNSSEIQQEEKLFDIVRHLNQGEELITQSSEREALAQLNLKAGLKARNSTAYQAARVYLQTGIDLLTANCWKNQYELTLNLYIAATEAAYLNADFDSMEQIAELVLQKAQLILDKVKIYQILIAGQTAQGKILEAIAVGREALLQLGVELPTEPDQALIGKALQTLASKLQARRIEELTDLPVMTNLETQAAMQLLGILFTPIFQGMPGLLPLLSSTMVSLSLSFGNAPASSVGYAIHSLVLCAFLGEVETGYNFGKVALNLLERFNVREFKPLILLLFGGFIQHRQESLRATIPLLKDGYRAGIETGDFLDAGYNINLYFFAHFFGGVELDTWETEIVSYNAALAQVKQYSGQIYLALVRQTAHNFREIQMLPDCLIGSAYDETVMMPKHHQDNELSALGEAYIYKLLLAYSFGNYTAALDHIAQAKQYLIAVSGLVFDPIFHFYAALTHLALFHTQPEIEQAEILAQVQNHQTALQQWAQNAPMNYLHKWYLVEAEKQRVLGNKAEPIDLYDRAISRAKENQFLNEEALSNELTAKFYWAWGKEKVAQAYMIEAYYCYARWGAKAKVEDLEKLYPQLLVPILEQPHTSVSLKESISGGILASNHPYNRISQVLDFATLLKASQTLSGEIELDKLLNTLLKIAIANAGATKCVLLLKQEQHLQVVALVQEGQEPELLPSMPLESSQEVAISLVNTVKRSLKPLVLVDARVNPQFAGDRYIEQHQPKSVLCSPILNQGKLIGILYLENNLTVGAFTSERVEVLNLLCSQGAISLQNARLYLEAQQAFADLKHAQIQIVQNEKMAALGNLVAGVAHEINNPVSFLSGNIHPALNYIQDLFGLVDLYQEKYPQPDPDIQEEIKSIELDYIREDLPKLVGSMNEGVKRIKEISTSLRTFSRADSDRPVACNIHQGLDSTLLILKHRLKANSNRPEIQVIKNYGDIPNVECFPGQLNQVFMNLLANAIEALEEANQGHSLAEIKANPNQIIINTELSDDRQWAVIRIGDNGMGMSDEVKEQIFDYLFTTKDVGKGTGIGLAIARQIVVEKHGGKLICNSTLGVGTEFAISLHLKN